MENYIYITSQERDELYQKKNKWLNNQNEKTSFSCIHLLGGASKNGDLTQIPTNHEWNGVFCDGQWIFYDTTWASSNFFENKEKISGPTNEEYIEMSFEEMSTQRRIDKLDFRNFYFAVSDYFN